jgi:transposase
VSENWSAGSGGTSKCLEVKKRCRAVGGEKVESGGASANTLDYMGFDIHKKTIQICVKRSDGEVLEELALATNRNSVEEWAKGRNRPWVGAMEATLFTCWGYDQLRPFAQDLQVAHPAMLEAIFAAKKKGDIVDARKLADLLRCNLIPQCYMAPTEIRELRRVLPFRNLFMRQMVRMKNKSAGLLMEAGVVYSAEASREALLS